MVNNDAAVEDPTNLEEAVATYHPTEIIRRCIFAGKVVISRGRNLPPVTTHSRSLLQNSLLIPTGVVC